MYQIPLKKYPPLFKFATRTYLKKFRAIKTWNADRLQCEENPYYYCLPILLLCQVILPSLNIQYKNVTHTHACTHVWREREREHRHCFFFVVVVFFFFFQKKIRFDISCDSHEILSLIFFVNNSKK